MQPNPSAEIRRPLLPSSRVFIWLVSSQRFLSPWQNRVDDDAFYFGVTRCQYLGFHAYFRKRLIAQMPPQDIQSTTINEARKWVQEHVHVDLETVQASLRRAPQAPVLTLPLPEDLLTAFGLGRYLCAELEQTTCVFFIIEHSVFSEGEELDLFQMAAAAVCSSFDIESSPGIICGPGEARQLVAVLGLGFALRWDMLLASEDPRLVMLTSHDGFVDIPVWEDEMKTSLTWMGFREAGG
jgi:hypothetical protein